MAKELTTIDQIIKRNETTSEDLRLAAELYEAERREKRSRKLIPTLDMLDRTETHAVERLRELRAQEKSQKERLLKLNAAKETFMKNGDENVLRKSLRSAGFIILG